MPITHEKVKLADKTINIVGKGTVKLKVEFRNKRNPRKFPICTKFKN